MAGGEAVDLQNGPSARTFRCPELRLLAQEFARPWMPWCEQDALRWTRLDDASRPHDDHLVGEGAHDVQVMAEQDDRDAACRDGGQLLDDTALGERVLTGGRLVGDDDPGTQQQSLREDDALLLATRELMRVTLQHDFSARELSLGEGAQNPFASRRPALWARQMTHLCAGDVGEERGDPTGGVENGCGVLRDVSHRTATHRSAAQRSGARRPAYVTGDVGAARELAEQGQPRGGLAAAGRADQGDDLAGQGPERHSVDDRPSVDLDP